MPVWLGRCLAVLLALVAFSASFVLYGGVRTLECNFGFSPAATAAAAGFVFLIGTLPASAFVVCAVILGRKPIPSAGQLALVLAACLAGIAACELFIIQDEHAFQAEAAQRDGHSYARDRCWPFGGCTLVCRADGGIHATD